MGEFTLVTELFFLFGFLRRKITGDSINQLRVMSIVNSDGDSSHVILNRFCLSQLFMASNNISVKNYGLREMFCCGRYVSGGDFN